MNKAASHPTPILVYFLLLPGYVLMEFAGAAEALRLANRDQPQVVYALHFIGPEAAVCNSLGVHSWLAGFAGQFASRCLAINAGADRC